MPLNSNEVRMRGMAKTNSMKIVFLTKYGDKCTFRYTSSALRLTCALVEYRQSEPAGIGFASGICWRRGPIGNRKEGAPVPPLLGVSGLTDRPSELEGPL